MLIDRLQKLGEAYLSATRETREKYLPYVRSVVSISIVLLCEQGNYIMFKKYTGAMLYLDYNKVTNRVVSCTRTGFKNACAKCSIEIPSTIFKLLEEIGLGNVPKEFVRHRIHSSFKKVIHVVSSESNRRKLGTLSTVLEFFIQSVYRGEIPLMLKACIHALEELTRHIKSRE